MDQNIFPKFTHIKLPNKELYKSTLEFRKQLLETEYKNKNKKKDQTQKRKIKD